MSWILRYMSPMLDYFEYEQIIESKPVNVREQILKGTNYLCVFQPHGALSFGGICSAVQAAVNADAGIEPHFIGNGAFPTAVASALLATPILKHVLGIFGLISASKKSMIRALQKKGVQGCVVLYVGGMAELFLSCENEEKLYLKQRKGFIKLALQQGVDVVPGKLRRAWFISLHLFRESRESVFCVTHIFRFDSCRLLRRILVSRPCTSSVSIRQYYCPVCFEDGCTGNSLS